MTPTCAEDFCPETVTDSSEIPEECSDYCTDITSADPSPDNQILVIYNRGLTMRTWSDDPVVLVEDGWCGVEQVRMAKDDHQTDNLRCGFVEVNGDQIVDYVVEEAGPYSKANEPRHRAFLSSGKPNDFATVH